MPVAVCLFGLLRSFEITYPRLKERILDPTGADVFFHGHPNKEGHEASLEKLLRVYAPKRYLLKEVTPEYIAETRNHRFDEFMKNKHRFTILDHFLSHMRNLEGVDRLRREHEAETGVKYDAVMFVRTDVFFLNPLPLDFVSMVSKDPSLIVIPSGPGGIWDVKHFGRDCVSDRFVLAHPDTATKYASLNSKCEDFFRQGVQALPEAMFGHLIKTEKLKRIDWQPPPFTFDDPDKRALERFNY